ncbi:MAG: hypothetical protein O3C28_04870 [Proteobacteria bacterium]|nr:hypothetical protein [Pseudomonadota bacterium]
MVSRALLLRILLIMVLAFSQAALIEHASAHITPDLSHCDLCLGYESGASALNPDVPFTSAFAAASMPARSPVKINLLAQPSHYFQSRADPVFAYSF